MSVQELEDMRKAMSPAEREKFDKEFNCKWLQLLDQLTYKEND